MVALAAIILFLNLVLTGSAILVLTDFVISDGSVSGNLSLAVIALAFFFAGDKPQRTRDRRWDTQPARTGARLTRAGPPPDLHS